MSESAIESELREQIADDIAEAIPDPIVTDGEWEYSRGLKKAIQIVEEPLAAPK